MGNTAPYYSLKNYTQVSGPNLVVIKVVVMLVVIKVVVMLVVKELVSKRSCWAPLPPAVSLYIATGEAAPAVQSTVRAADKKAPDHQVQNGQPGIW